MAEATLGENNPTVCERNRATQPGQRFAGDNGGEGRGGTIAARRWMHGEHDKGHLRQKSKPRFALQQFAFGLWSERNRNRNRDRSRIPFRHRFCKGPRRYPLVSLTCREQQREQASKIERMKFDWLNWAASALGIWAAWDAALENKRQKHSLEQEESDWIGFARESEARRRREERITCPEKKLTRAARWRGSNGQRKSKETDKQ
ncbi:hypothetical protein LR48_Vigan07g173600 [Vigna angularis]|uniref:Uncharacterized protein n=1 Tax=Phaseolus angularis TaxID=3914 RepID=A0A0L9UZN0_PHAAN|nr:hypothetical protein LR48_Vigan07g173600 [Vigna angularis]